MLIFYFFNKHHSLIYSTSVTTLSCQGAQWDPEPAYEPKPMQTWGKYMRMYKLELWGGNTTRTTMTPTINIAFSKSAILFYCHINSRFSFLNSGLNIKVKKSHAGERFIYTGQLCTRHFNRNRDVDKRDVFLLHILVGPLLRMAHM